VSVKGWLQPGWDLGVVLVNGGAVVGAAWWRAFHGVELDGPSPSVREAFLGIIPEFRDEGCGSRLFDSLLTRARASESVTLIVGRPSTGRSRGMLERRHFTENSDWVSHGANVFWQLDV
jgi:GNAT superfamily N-acetyltransferase